jgi:hypothetical protein
MTASSSSIRSRNSKRVWGSEKGIVVNCPSFDEVGAVETDASDEDDIICKNTNVSTTCGGADEKY